MPSKRKPATTTRKTPKSETIKTHASTVKRHKKEASELRKKVVEGYHNIPHPPNKKIKRNDKQATKVHKSLTETQHTNELLENRDKWSAAQANVDQEMHHMKYKQKLQRRRMFAKKPQWDFSANVFK